MTAKYIIEKLRNAIPEMKCKITCNDCCGPIPFSKHEWSLIKDKRKATSFVCPYSSVTGCDIYENRPIICRMFGVSEDSMIKCPHGFKTEKPLSIEKSDQIRRIYHKIIHRG